MADGELMSAEDLRSRLYNSLKEKGLLDALKVRTINGESDCCSHLCYGIRHNNETITDTKFLIVFNSTQKVVILSVCKECSFYLSVQ